MPLVIKIPLDLHEMKVFEIKMSMLKKQIKINIIYSNQKFGKIFEFVSVCLPHQKRIIWNSRIDLLCIKCEEKSSTAYFFDERVLILPNAYH